MQTLRKAADFQAIFYTRPDVWIFPRPILQLFHHGGKYFHVYLKKILQNFGSIFFGVLTCRRIEPFFFIMPQKNMP